MTWKLPKHLELYREYLCVIEGYDSVEEQYNDKENNIGWWYEMELQIDLLQRLYDDGMLKQ